MTFWGKWKTGRCCWWRFFFLPLTFLTLDATWDVTSGPHRDFQPLAVSFLIVSARLGVEWRHEREWDWWGWGGVNSDKPAIFVKEKSGGGVGALSLVAPFYRRYAFKRWHRKQKPTNLLRPKDLMIEITEIQEKIFYLINDFLQNVKFWLHFFFFFLHFRLYSFIYLIFAKVESTQIVTTTETQRPAAGTTWRTIKR